MSNKEKYPDWGAFGTSVGNTAPGQMPETAASTGSNTWELTDSVRIGEKVFTVEYTNDDLPEKVEQALARRDIEVARSGSPSVAGSKALQTYR